jgi:hypothetical protein
MARKLNIAIEAFLAGGQRAYLMTDMELQDDADAADVADQLDDLINNTIKNKHYLRLNSICLHGEHVQAASWTIVPDEEE